MSLREYIRYLVLENKDCKSPKLIFMAGGPGSGKTRVINQLGLRIRMRVINPDDQYEAAMKAECIPMNRESIMDEYMPIRSEYLDAERAGDSETVERLRPDYERLRNILSRNMTLFNQARAQAKRDREECCANLEDYVVDGTGGNLSEFKRQVKDAKDRGYEIGMIYVHVPLEVSYSRNRERGKAKPGSDKPNRSLTPGTVKRSWTAVARNRAAYEQLFKSNFFVVVNTDEESEASINNVRSHIASFLES